MHPPTSDRSSRRVRLALALLALALSTFTLTTACDAQPKPDAPPADRADLAEAPTPDPLFARVGGRWKGEELCLELFANGDFELSDMRHREGPKVLVMGRTALRAGKKGAVEADLTVDKIWAARWTSRCREIHETGQWLDAHGVANITFEPGKATTVTLRKLGPDRLELCADDRCTTLGRDAPLLGARWRRAGLSSPRQPESPWRAGDLLELNISGDASHLWFGHTDTGWNTVYGALTVKSRGGDRFDLSFKVDRMDDLPDGAVPAVLGQPLKAGKTTLLHVRRLPGQHVEVCGASDRCAVLDREFDEFSYNLQ